MGSSAPSAARRPKPGERIDRFEPAGESRPFPGSDLDGDGIGDALIGQVHTSDGSLRHPTGSHTAIARSGRDGHVLWKSVLDPPGIWFDRDRGDSYEFSTFPMPAGDLDSDGMPDVLVKRDVSRFSQAAIERPAALPLQALSGRTGRFLWSAGPLHLGFAAQGILVDPLAMPARGPRHRAGRRAGHRRAALQPVRQAIGPAGAVSLTVRTAWPASRAATAASSGTSP